MKCWKGRQSTEFEPNFYTEEVVNLENMMKVMETVGAANKDPQEWTSVQSSPRPNAQLFHKRNLDVRVAMKALGSI